MLSLLTEFFSNRAELLFDVEHNRCVLMIEKNASTSQFELGTTQSNKFKYIPADQGIYFLEQNNIQDVTVFLRDPIERFKSGLVQAARNFGIGQQAINDIIFGQLQNPRMNYGAASAHIYPLDNHMAPQFWTILRIPKHLNITFHFLPLSQYSTMFPVANKVNVSTNDFGIPTHVLDKVDLYYTEDIVLYNQFLNSSATLVEILERIKQESQFVEHLSNYSNLLSLYHDLLH
jgi:hypothetical protein